MSKTGFYQCEYPTDTACVFSEDNDLLPDGALECGPRRDDGPAVARAAHPLVGMRIRRRVRLTSSEMNTTTRQKRPLQTTRRTTSPTWLEPAMGLKTPPEAREGPPDASCEEESERYPSTYASG